MAHFEIVDRLENLKICKSYKSGKYFVTIKPPFPLYHSDIGFLIADTFSGALVLASGFLLWQKGELNGIN